MTGDSNSHDLWAQVAAELRAQREAQRQTWGDLDNAILGRYLASEATPEECRLVEATVAQHPELRKLIDLVGEVLDDVAVPEAAPVRPAVEAPAPAILPMPRRPTRRVSWRSAGRHAAALVAASLLLAAGTLFGFWLNAPGSESPGTRSNLPVTQSPDVRDDESRVAQLVADKQERDRELVQLRDENERLEGESRRTAGWLAESLGRLEQAYADLQARDTLEQLRGQKARGEAETWFVAQQLESVRTELAQGKRDAQANLSQLRNLQTELPAEAVLAARNRANDFKAESSFLKTAPLAPVTPVRSGAGMRGSPPSFGAPAAAEGDQLDQLTGVAGAQASNLARPDDLFGGEGLTPFRVLRDRGYRLTALPLPGVSPGFDKASDKPIRMLPVGASSERGPIVAGTAQAHPAPPLLEGRASDPVFFRVVLVAEPQEATTGRAGVVGGTDLAPLVNVAAAYSRPPSPYFRVLEEKETASALPPGAAPTRPGSLAADAGKDKKLQEVEELKQEIEAEQLKKATSEAELQRLLAEKEQRYREAIELHRLLYEKQRLEMTPAKAKP